MAAEVRAQPHSPAPSPATWRWGSRALRRGWTTETKNLTGLVVFALALITMIAIYPSDVPLTSLMVPLLLGVLLLSPRHLPWFVVFMVVLVVLGEGRQVNPQFRTYVAGGIQVLMCAIVLVVARRRTRLGVGGAAGESMFVDLRDRILGNGGIPVLPAEWHVESALRSAGGTPFAGDFVVATRPAADRLEVVVVDVSGKGEQAGTRALLLSGAFGGLLGALPPDRFLAAANDYLLSQDWEEGFATAIHLSLHLDDGSFEVRTAGHPPAALRAVGSGRWTVLPTEGPILGLMADATYVEASGRINHRDALLLYTDGMVEEPRRDIDLGIDRMLGQAERLIRGTWQGAARRLVDALGSRDDDRAMVVVTRV